MMFTAILLAMASLLPAEAGKCVLSEMCTSLKLNLGRIVPHLHTFGSWFCPPTSYKPDLSFYCFISMGTMFSFTNFCFGSSVFPRRVHLEWRFKVYYDISTPVSFGTSGKKYICYKLILPLLYFSDAVMLSGVFPAIVK